MEAPPRHASAFALDLGPEKRLRWAAAFVFAVAAAALSFALASHDAVADRPRCSEACWFGLTLLILPAAAWLGWMLAGHEPLRLRWDGQAWHLGAACASGQMEERAVHVRVALDFDDWLLLHIRSTRGWAPGRYLALCRADQSAHWQALRATLYVAVQQRAGEEGAPPWT